MSPAPRVIACLDVDGGRVVKGVRFRDLRIVGDPVEAAAAYEEQGADEIVFLDVSASIESREILVDVVRNTASVLTIPLTVGGGIRTREDVILLLRNGADKVAVNTAAVETPALLTAASEAFGAQCVVLAIDAKRAGDSWGVYTHGGRKPTALDAIEWARKGQALGAGEFLVTSMDRDGTRDGYDLELYRRIRAVVRGPIIASGGCGCPEHVVEVLQDGFADAALVASVLHDGDLTVERIKDFALSRGIRMRREA